MKKLSLGETDFLKTSQLWVAAVGLDPGLHHCVWQMSSTFDWLNLSFQGQFHLKLFWAFKHLNATALGERIFGWEPDDWNSHLGLMGSHLAFTEPQFPCLWGGATQSTSHVRLMNTLPQRCFELSHPLETKRRWLYPQWSHSEFHNNVTGVTVTPLMFLPYHHPGPVGVIFQQVLWEHLQDWLRSCWSLGEVITRGLLVSRTTSLRRVSFTEWPPDSHLLLFLESSLSGSGAGGWACPGQPAPWTPSVPSVGLLPCAASAGGCMWFWVPWLPVCFRSHFQISLLCPSKAVADDLAYNSLSRTAFGAVGHSPWAQGEAFLAAAAPVQVGC